MGSELYIYYKLEAAKADEVQAAFEALRILLLRQWPAMQSRLLKRTTDAQGLQTWMEIHAWTDAHPPADWQAQLQRLAEPLVAPLRAQRHHEQFEQVR